MEVEHVAAVLRRGIKLMWTRSWLMGGSKLIPFGLMLHWPAVTAWADLVEAFR